jgi:prephenate dehydratase
MEDNAENFTRFLALGPAPLHETKPGRKGYKTSIVFSLSNTPGSLFKGLSALALRDINLTKVESRPLPGRPWEYLFYVDFEGHVDMPSCKRALEHIKEMAPFLRVLGSYPEHPHRFNWR